MESAATTVSDVVTALTTAMGTVATGAMGAVSGIIPVAAPVLGAILVIGIGIRTFKKVSGGKN